MDRETYQKTLKRLARDLKRDSGGELEMRCAAALIEWIAIVLNQHDREALETLLEVANTIAEARMSGDMVIVRATRGEVSPASIDHENN